jgi:hypothetical protein
MGADIIVLRVEPIKILMIMRIVMLVIGVVLWIPFYVWFKI